MPKTPPPPLDIPAEVPAPRGRSARAVALGLVVAPIIYEATQRVVAGWQTIFGGSSVARTPVLDALGAAMAVSYRAATEVVTRVVIVWTWAPRAVIALGLAWALLALQFLRRR